MVAQKTALMTVIGDNAAPSLAEAAAQLGVGIDDLNQVFGVVAIDPARKLYAVEVQADRLPQQAQQEGSFRGPYSNPPIQPIGPPTGDGGKSDK